MAFAYDSKGNPGSGTMLTVKANDEGVARVKLTYRQAVEYLSAEAARELADDINYFADQVSKANTFKLPTGIGAVIHYKDRHQNTYVRVSNSTWRYVATGTHYSDEDFRNVSADDYEILSEGVELD
jgi:hypothetical protein